MEIPGIGILALVQRHRGLLGFDISLFLGPPPPLAIEIGPMLIGMMQVQQISVIGFTKRPLHGKLAYVE
jgi:hypothetical protein